MKIVDAFIFFHEFDLLESRLQYLYNHIDYFVVVESNRSFVGKSKPLHFLENRNRYAPYLDKIIYSPFLLSQSEFEKLQTEYSTKELPWQIEKAQRNHIAEAVKMFDDNDLILISDVDEIPNYVSMLTHGISWFKNNDDPVVFSQEYLMYNLERKYVIPNTQYGWRMSVATKRKILKNYTPSQLRGLVDVPFPKLGFIDGGWHLSSFMPADGIIDKLQNYSHTEYLTEENQNSLILEDWIKNDMHFATGKGYFEYVTRESYPDHFLAVFEKYFDINTRNNNSN